MFMDAANPFSWVEPVTHLGVPGFLTLGIVALWRAYQAEREANMDWQREAIQHQAQLEQIPQALDRLRTETIQEIRAGFQICGKK